MADDRSSNLMADFIRDRMEEGFTCFVRNKQGVHREIVEVNTTTTEQAYIFSDHAAGVPDTVSRYPIPMARLSDGEWVSLGVNDYQKWGIGTNSLVIIKPVEPSTAEE